MGFGDILDEAFDLYKSNFVVIVGIPAIFFLAYQFCYGMITYPIANKFQKMATIPPNGTPAPNFDTSMFTTFFITQVVFMVILLILNAIVTGPLTYAISQRYLGEKVTIGSAYKFIFKRLGAYLATFGIYSAIVFGPMIIAAGIGFGVMAFNEIAGILTMSLLFLASIVFFVIFYLRLQLMIPVFIVEGLRPIASLIRSWRLINGYIGHVFGIQLVTSLIIGIIVSIITGVSGQILRFTLTEGIRIPVQSSIDAIVTTAFFSLSPIVLILLYYDTRIRKEGFDLQMLARDLAGTSGQPAGEQAGGVSAQPSDLQEACAYCHFPIRAEDDLVRCPDCGATMHKSCWAEQGGCTTPGCSSSKTAGGF